MLKAIKQDPFQYFVVLSSFLLVISSYFMPLTVDVSLHLFHSVRMVEDGGLYTRWVEVMPPPIYLIYSIPVYFGKLTHFGYEHCVIIFVDILSATSLLLINSSLKKGGVENRIRKSILTGCLAAFFILPIYTASVNDRDTLFMFFCFPWMINRIFRLKSSWMVVILAAIGFSIKQYNYLYPFFALLLLEDFGRDYFKRLFSRQNLLLGFTIIIMNLIFILKFTAYYTEMLPVILTSYKGFYNTNYSAIIISVFLFAVIICFFVRSEELKRYLRPYIIFFGISLLILYFNGDIKYNSNHSFSLMILAVFHIIGSQRNEQIRYIIKVFAGMAVLLTLMIQVMVFYAVINFKVTEDNKQCDMRELSYTNRPYMMLSVGLWAFKQNYTGPEHYPYENKNHMFAIDHLWMMPWLYNHKDDPESEIVKNYLRKKVIEGLQRDNNISILVDVSKLHYSMPEKFNALDFFRKELDLKDELKEFQKVDYIECGDQMKMEIWQKK